MAVDPRVSAGLSPEQIAGAVQLGQQMRNQPLDAQYKRALIEQMGGSMGMRAIELQEQMRQNQVTNQLNQQKLALDQEEIGIKNRLLEFQQREEIQKARLTEAEIAQKNAMTSRLQTIQDIKGSIQVGNMTIPANAFDPTDLVRYETANIVANQREDPGKVFDEVFKEQLRLARPGDPQANEKARAATIEYMKTRFGPEVAARYSWGAGAGRVSGKNPLGW